MLFYCIFFFYRLFWPLYIPHLAFNSMFSLRYGLPPMFIPLLSPTVLLSSTSEFPQVHELTISPYPPKFTNYYRHPTISPCSYPSSQLHHLSSHRLHLLSLTCLRWPGPPSRPSTLLLRHCRPSTAELVQPQVPAHTQNLIKLPSIVS